jgi:hypothetical protein
MAGDYVLIWLRPDGGIIANATFAKTMSQYPETSWGAVRATLDHQT